jgi:uncharacterized membrane protein
MSFSPILVLHICAGTLALFSGAAAMSFRKGSHRHRVAGNVFVLSMLSMAAAAVYLAFVKHQMGNVFGGILTFYLVTTAWLTARRRDGETHIFDWGALLVALAIGATIMIYGLEKATGKPGLNDGGVPVGMYFFLSSVVLLAAAGDIRMLVRGVSGTQRLVRHLWRMCFALFFATGSFFLGPQNRPLRLLRAVGLKQQLFAALLGKNVLLLLAVLPLILMIFWVFRVRFTNAFKEKPMPVPGGDAQYDLELRSSSRAI